MEMTRAVRMAAKTTRLQTPPRSHASSESMDSEELLRPVGKKDLKSRLRTDLMTTA